MYTYAFAYLYGKMSYSINSVCLTFLFGFYSTVAAEDEASSTTWDRIMLRCNQAAPITSGTRTVRVNATVYKLHNIDRDKTIAVIGID
jgi:hypothetical protein